MRSFRSTFPGIALMELMMDIRYSKTSEAFTGIISSELGTVMQRRHAILECSQGKSDMAMVCPQMQSNSLFLYRQNTLKH